MLVTGPKHQSFSPGILLPKHRLPVHRQTQTQGIFCDFSVLATSLKAASLGEAILSHL